MIMASAKVQHRVLVVVCLFRCFVRCVCSRPFFFRQESLVCLGGSRVHFLRVQALISPDVLLCVLFRLSFSARVFPLRAFPLRVTQ